MNRPSTPALHPQAPEREGDEQRASKGDGIGRCERCAQHGHVRHDDDEDRDDHSDGAEVTLPMHGLLGLAGERVVQVHEADRPRRHGRQIGVLQSGEHLVESNVAVAVEVLDDASWTLTMGEVNDQRTAAWHEDALDVTSARDRQQPAASDRT